MRQALDVVQVGACRLGGVNEVLAVLLMAAKYELPVCPHAGRVAKYVDHLHEHFVNPREVRNAAYVVPRAPGFSIEIKPAARERFRRRGGEPGAVQA